MTDIETTARQIVEKIQRDLFRSDIHPSEARKEHIAAIAAALEAERLEERREIMNLLGMDENGQGLVTVEDWDGRPANFCHDPYYALEGALIDLRRQDADKVCISTIGKVQEQLAAVSKRAAAIRSRETDNG